MTKQKTILMVTAGLAALGAISAPVIAGHSHGMALRGAFQSDAHQGAYVAPQSWQEKRLRSRLHQQVANMGPGTYVVTDTIYPAQHQGAHQHGQVTYDGVHVTGQTAHSGIGLRGYSDPSRVRYSEAAARDFKTQRHFDVGGLNVRTSALHSRDMLDWQESVTGKTLTLLANRSSGVLKDDSLYFGGGVQGGLMYQKTSVDGQFPLLSRFPFFTNRTDDESAVFAINHAALALTSTFGDWTTVYLQPEYSETEYPGEQDEFQLRKAFVVFGNLEKSPFYAAFGRKTIDFGNFDSYNAFTQNEGHHYFWAVADQPVLELGYYDNGFKIVGSVFSGGRQLRTAYAAEENNIGNFAFNAEKEFRLGQSSAFTLGGGYLHDTIYRNNWTAHTFRGILDGAPPANFIQYRNSAVNAFAEYNSPMFDAMVEYTTTLEPWAAAIPQTPDGTPFPEYLIDPAGSTTSIDNLNFDQNLEVLTAQLRYKPWVNGRQMAIAATGSWGNISDDRGNIGIFGQPTSFEKNQQHGVSVEYPISDFLDVGAEYVYNKGFIPFVNPQGVSNDQTEAHAINIGFKARF